MTVIKELDKEFRLPVHVLEKFIGYEANNNSKRIKSEHLNYFSIVVLLYYIGDFSKYSDVKRSLVNYIKEYIELIPPEKRSKSSEITHLILDIFTCPFITVIDKKEIFNIFKNGSPNQYDNLVECILDFQKKKNINYWFTKWKRFNLAKEFEYKKSQEVYS
ncbi:hypothetical protein M2306_001608 [Myroides gitamensis]|nr:hypothetical protein [Myroides gitamensis]